jgi:hypothetical protein
VNPARGPQRPRLRTSGRTSHGCARATVRRPRGPPVPAAPWGRRRRRRAAGPRPAWRRHAARRGPARGPPRLAEAREQQEFVGDGERPIITDGLPAQYPDIDEVETAEWLESFDAVVEAARQVAGPLPAAEGARTGPPAEHRDPVADHHRLHQHDPAGARAATSPATSTSSGASAPTSGGTPPSWSTAPTSSAARAATSAPTPRRPPSTRSGSTTSSAARTTPAAATRSTSRATPRRASTPARSSRAGSTRSSSTASAPRSTRAGCRATRTRG